MNVLDEILPNNLWYIIGYIVADGNLSKNGRNISIISKDIEHLFKIRSALKIDCKIVMSASGYTREKKYGRIQFSNTNLYRYLESINIGPNKSLIQGPIILDFKYIGDFIRGLIDGDGSIYNWKHSTNNTTQWAVTIASGSIKLIEWLQNIIVKHYGIEGRVHTAKSLNKTTMHSIKFGKITGQVLLKRIYYKNCLCLDRKKKLAISCLLDSKKMVNYNSVICSDGGTGIRATLKMS